MQEERAEFFIGRCFMVDGQQTPINRSGGVLAIRTQTEPFHAVMVVACTVMEIGVSAVVFVRGGVGGEWVAQCIKHAEGVPGRQHHRISQTLGNSRET